MADVFISYARADTERVEQISNALDGEGFTVWWDTSLKAGETFDTVIESELEAAKCVVAVWSRTSVGRKWVRNEAREGEERNILVPVLIDNVRPPIEFRNIQTVDLSSWKGRTDESQWQRFVGAVKEKVTVPSGEKKTYIPERRTLPVRGVLAYIVAVLVTAILSTVFHTQMVLGEFSALGHNIPLNVRLETTVHDILNMGLRIGAMSLLTIIAVGFLIAFIVAALIIKFLLPRWRTFGFTLAGATAMFSMLYLMAMQFDGITPIAGARGDLGLALQTVAGGIGGYVFGLLLPRR